MSSRRAVVLSVVLALATSAIPAWAQSYQSVQREVERVEALRESEDYIPHSPRIADHRRMVALDRQLLDLYRARARFDTFVDPAFTRVMRADIDAMEEHLAATESLLAEAEGYFAKYGTEALMGCEYIAGFERDVIESYRRPSGDASLDRAQSQAAAAMLENAQAHSRFCVNEMPKRYPAAWRLLQQRGSRRLEFDAKAGNDPFAVASALQRILSESGTFRSTSTPDLPFPNRRLPRPIAPVPGVAPLPPLESGPPEGDKDGWKRYMPDGWADPAASPGAGMPPSMGTGAAETPPSTEDPESLSAEFRRARIARARARRDAEPSPGWRGRVSEALYLSEIQSTGTVLFWWFVIATLIRLAVVVPARMAGAYDPLHFRYLLWPQVPWRWPYRGLMVLVRWFRQMRFGTGATARWTGVWETMTYVLSPGDRILLGRLWFHRIRFPRFVQPVSIPGGERHVAMFGGAGSGKTTQLKTMIACMDPKGAAFIIDMDGAMVWALRAGLERAGHRVAKIDFDGLAPGESASWNLFDEITRADARHGRSAVVSFVALAAEALITQDSTTQPVFANTARVFYKGLLLYVWMYDDDKTLMRVRSLLCRGLPEKKRTNEDPFNVLLFEMTECVNRDDGCGGVINEAIANAVGALRGDSDKGGNFRSTAIYQTAWIDDPAIVARMRRSDVSGEDFKTTNVVCFLVATLSDLQTRLAPFFRAFTMLTLYAFQKTEPQTKVRIPALFVLDEMPSIGRMEMVATAAPGFRKYGVRLITVSQSLQRLQKTYPDEWKDFIGNAQCVIWMGLNDPDTLRFLSEQGLGKCLRREKIEGTPWWWPARRIPSRYQQVERWLLDVQQCGAFLDPTTEQIIVTRFGRAPMRLMRLPYYRELPVWKTEPHPSLGESMLRRMLRAWLVSRFRMHASPTPLVTIYPAQSTADEAAEIAKLQ